MRDRDAADDLFQETFVKIITKLQQGRYSPTGKFSAWIMRIAHNVIMDWYRAQRADKVIDAPKDNDLSNVGGDDTVIDNIECQFINSQTLSDVKRMMTFFLQHSVKWYLCVFTKRCLLKRLLRRRVLALTPALGVCVTPYSTCGEWFVNTK